MAVITRRDLEAVLYYNFGNTQGGRERITEFFAKNKDIMARANFCKKEFGIGGTCPAYEQGELTHQLDAMWDSKGVEISLNGI